MNKLLLSIIALSLPAMAAYAEQPLFDQLDADNNGSLSKAEVQTNPKLTALFDKLDTDLDGQLSLTEYQVLNKKQS